MATKTPFCYLAEVAAEIDQGFALLNQSPSKDEPAGGVAGRCNTQKSSSPPIEPSKPVRLSQRDLFARRQLIVAKINDTTSLRLLSARELYQLAFEDADEVVRGLALILLAQASGKLAEREVVRQAVSIAFNKIFDVREANVVQAAVEMWLDQLRWLVDLVHDLGPEAIDLGLGPRESAHQRVEFRTAVEAWSWMLSPEASRRVMAIVFLSRQSPSDETLAKACRRLLRSDPSDAVRSAAVGALLKYHGGEKIDALFAELSEIAADESVSPPVRDWSRQTLAELSDIGQ